MNVLKFIFARLKEKSTITTIVTLILGIVGVNVSPENQDVIITAAGGVISAIAIFWGQDEKTGE